jgi:hypothetical protein|tara:strand:- start:1145 stop:1522 length:378 start_codon:yes stop_codon:yes gene_type:complete
MQDVVKGVFDVKYIPTDEERTMVEKMASIGITQEDISKVVGGGIERHTLAKHFRKELDTAKIKANAAIGLTLYNKALNGDTASLIWYSKAQMGWREKSQIEIEHSGDLSVSINLTPVKALKIKDK